MTLRRVTAPEAKQLIDEEGYALLDVRSTPEYEAEHPAGAYNVPYLHKAPHGMVPNTDFAKIVQQLFPEKGTRIVTSCQMGGRSLRAAQELLNLGYSNVVDLRGGFGSERDATGAIVIAGWKDSGLPVEAGEPADRAYGPLVERLSAPKAEAESCGAAPAPETARNRFAHATLEVECVKLGRRLPALKRTPVGGPLGKRIKDTISADAWVLWVEHSKMIINEFRLNPADAKAQEMLLEQCEKFFFSEGAQLPPDYVPPASK